MIDHMGIGAKDFAASKRFYEAALATLGIAPLVEVIAEQSGGYTGVGYGAHGKPVFWLSSDGPRGGGLHVAFTAPDRAAVDAFFEAAMRHGGRNNGEPGLRPHYHRDYYGAFVLDPDGVNVEAVCRSPA